MRRGTFWTLVCALRLYYNVCKGRSETHMASECCKTHMSQRSVSCSRRAPPATDRERFPGQVPPAELQAYLERVKTAVLNLTGTESGIGCNREVRGIAFSRK